MNEQMQATLMGLVERAISSVDAAVEFSQAQIPEVIEQMLAWRMVESILWNIPAVLLVVGMLVLFRCMFKQGGWAREDDGTFDEDGVGFYCATTPVVLFLTWLVVDFDWIQILIAPKFYLLEYATSLLK